MDSRIQDSGSNFSSESDDEERGDVPIIKSSRPSFIGRIRTVRNVKIIEWSFIILSVLTIAVGFGFTLYRMSTISPDSDQYVFAILVMINLVFATYYLFHGVFQEQPFEILMYLFTTILIGALVTINFASAESNRDKLRLIRFIVTMVLSLPNIIIGSSLGWQYWASGALIFKTVGADMKLQRMCRTFFFGLSLLVFDCQAGISCIILVMQNGLTGMTNEEIVILVTGAIFTATWLIVGYTALRMENVRLTWLFAFTSIVQPLYVLYLFVQGLEQFEKPYSLRTKSAFLAGGILLLTHFTLLSIICVISSNFDKGLKTAIYGGEFSSSNGTPRRADKSSIEDDEEPLIGSQPHSSQIQNYDAILPAP